MQLQIGYLSKVSKKYFATFVFLLLGFFFILRVTQITQHNRYLFDEDFFAYTAQLMKQNDSRIFEWWHGPLEQEVNQFSYRPPAIEWLHPPLSKSIQAVSIALFGNSPFGWRLPSVLAGIGIIWLSIEFTQLLFGKNYLSLLVGFLISTEQLITTQSKIASPDIFLAFFVLLTVWRFWHYHQKRTVFRLINVGISLGLAVSCKWSGAFILPALLVFEFVFLSQSATLKTSIRPLLLLLQTTIILMFVAGSIYILSYWQLFHQGHSVQYFFDLHKQIVTYQTSTSFDRPYASKPLEWLLGEKPIWYHYDQLETGEVSEIIAKPTLWLLFASELAFLISVGELISQHYRKKISKECWPKLLLLLSITSLFIPWLFISRPVFIYHFTPIVPLAIMLSISTFLNLLPKLSTNNSK